MIHQMYKIDWNSYLSVHWMLKGGVYRETNSTWLQSLRLVRPP